MKFHRSLLIGCLLGLSPHLYAGAIEDLATRILGEPAAKQLIFEKRNLGTPYERVYQISTTPDAKILITGDDTITQAAGLYGYLKEVAHAHVSWSGDQLQLPTLLPKPQTPITRRTRERHATAFNYCTFNYTMAWWNTQRWQRELDLLALYGIDQPLAIVGTEAVWQNTLKRIGYSDSDIKPFLAGPGYTAWWLMGNIEGVGGPVSDATIQARVDLQKNILKRMRELEMTPIFQGFVGVVPASLPQIIPGTKVIPQGQWVGMPRPPVLHPDDPLFDRLAKIWYEELSKLYGETQFFAGDLFHEGGISKGINVPAMARKVQQAMIQHHPQAVWTLQGWSGNPSQALLKDLDRQHIQIIELCNEFFRNWEKNNGFWQSPWTFGTVIQYGGNTSLHGRLAAIEQNLADARQSPNPPQGLGLIWESTGINPIVADFLMDLRWHPERITPQTWAKDYFNRRYGHHDPKLSKAAEILVQTAYGTYPNHRRPTESILCARPSSKVIKTSPFAASVDIPYDLRPFRQALQDILAVAPSCQNVPAYRYDIVDFTRQFLTSIALIVERDMEAADLAKNASAYEHAANEFLEILNHQEQLLASHEAFMVGPWLNAARNIAPHNEADAYEKQARCLITTWFPNRTPQTLSDYAWREWSGLIKDYAGARWRAWIQYRLQSLQGKPTPAPDWQTIETQWTQQTQATHPYPSLPTGNPITISQQILDRWGPILDQPRRYTPPTPHTPTPSEASQDAR